MTAFVQRIPYRRHLAVAVDAVIIGAAYYLALALRFDGNIPDGLGSRGYFPFFAALALAVHVGCNWGARVYGIMNRYIGLQQAVRLVQAVGVSMIALAVIVFVVPTREHLVPLSVVPVGSLVALVGMVGVRFYTRIFHERSLVDVDAERNLLIIGAGHTADAVLRDMANSAINGTRPVGILDDNRRLRGLRLQDVPILGPIDELARVLRSNDVTDVLIASDVHEPETVAHVHRVCHQYKIGVKTMPRLDDVIDGRPSATTARELRIEDFLGRPPVETDLKAITALLAGKRVLVTGAAGSIGSELCRQIAAFAPSVLLMVDKDESGLYSLREELTGRRAGEIVIKPTSVTLHTKMDRLFAQHRPEMVFHAAAFKHVPLMELSPDEAVVNNIRGTMVIAEAAGKHGVERMVNISTDKAVEPMSVMGATKRAGEILIQFMAERHPKTSFRTVRFGNVLGSRGSVLPLFKQQIEAGEPLTITHPAMSRYFMTIEEAVQLVLQTAALDEEFPDLKPGWSGAYVLEMGSPVMIVDLALKMMSLLNGKPGDQYIIFTGLRPGEKIEEQLFGPLERPIPTSHPMIRLAAHVTGDGEATRLPPQFDENLHRLITLAEEDADPAVIIEALREVVTDFTPVDPTSHAID